MLTSDASGGQSLLGRGPSGGIAARLAALQHNGQTGWRARVQKDEVVKISATSSVHQAQDLIRSQLTTPAPSSYSPPSLSSPSPLPSDSGPGSLADRLGQLETAAQGWKARVAGSDAPQFSVRGRMRMTSESEGPSPGVAERQKRTPRPERFKCKSATNIPQTLTETSGLSSSHSAVIRTSSVPDQSPPTLNGNQNSEDERLSSSKDKINGHDGEMDATIKPASRRKREIETNQSDVNSAPKVVVPRIDSDLDAFFVTMATEEESEKASVGLDYRIEDFDNLVRSEQQLVSLKSRVKVTRRRAVGSKNPIKALSERTDLIQNEYTQVLTGLADRELKRINVENLSAKNSNLAVEALAGLASNEDFAAISLKSTEDTPPPLPMDLAPYVPLMLLQVKGRRHVQTRLVEPQMASVNRGDSYVLVTPKEVYHYTGQYANVIEKSRGAEIAQHILVQHDLGCSASSVFTISDAPCRLSRKFWRHLGATESEAETLQGLEAGHPDEDEVYEMSILDTNMIYELQSGDDNNNPELVPMEKYWGAIPKIEMLDTNKILVFDFGSELYIWMGKNATLDRRKVAITLCKQLWAQGANYTDCDISPLGNIKQCDSRPGWCLIAKVTQHMETCLFREKFADWPDFTRVIRLHQEKKNKMESGDCEIVPVEGKLLVKMEPVEPDLVLEGTHLGRGVNFFDPELRKLNEIRTLDLKVWHIEEFESTLLKPESHGQFHSGDSYILRWHYSVTITGRELSGQPSRHNIVGRDRYVYFIWQGATASLNEQGAAALLTIQLDEERGPQVRIGAPCKEPPAFLNIFGGGYVCYYGKRSEMKHENRSPWRLFTIRGSVESEAQLLEVACSIRQLRSRASLVLVNTSTGETYLWHGVRVSTHNLQVATSVVSRYLARNPAELCLPSSPLPLTTIHEGQEPSPFFAGLGGDARLMYHSLTSTSVEDRTPLLFSLSSTLGVFSVNLVTSHIYHPDLLVPFPYLQTDLYSAAQPTLFLLDTGSELWLWQGWWEEESETDTTDNISVDPEDQLIVPDVQGHRLGSRGHRYNEERRAAMETALSYRHIKYGDVAPSIGAYLVWAGLEPLAFTNLFQVWTDRDDIAEINIKDGHKPGDMRPMESELSKLSRATYPPSELTQRPLPDGVDPTKLEVYLSNEHFVEVLKMTREEFNTLPFWRQCKIKQQAGLF